MNRVLAGNIRAGQEIGTWAQRPPTRYLSRAGTAVVTAVILPLAVSVTRFRRALLAVILLDIPLQVGNHLFWSDELAESGTLGGLEISVTSIALLGLYFSWFVSYVSKRERANLISFRSIVPFSLYLAFQVISLLAARDPAIGWYEVVLTSQMLLLLLYLSNWLRTRADVVFVLKTLVLGVLLEALIIIGLKFRGEDVVIPGLPGHTLLAQAPEGTDDLPRLGGSLVSPNVAGSYLSVVLTLVAGLLLFARPSAPYKMLLMLAFGAGATALLMTYSRGGWLALICSVSLLVLIGRHYVRRSHKLLVVGVFAGLAITLFSTTRVSERVFGSDEGSASSRLVLDKLAIEMIADHPLLGVGANNFSLHLGEYATSDVMGEWLYVVHNKFLLIWAEAGPGALLAYVCFVYASLRVAWRAWKNKDPLASPLALTIWASIVALMICDMFQSDRGRPLMQLLVVLAALPPVLSRCLKTAPVQPQSA